MITDQLRVPGLVEPLSVDEYAKLEGLDEENVIEAAFHGKISAVYLLGWYLEAPPYSEERVSRLRGESKLEPRLANWLQQRVALHDDAQYDSEQERLRVQLVKSHWRYDRLTPAQQQALLGTKQYAERPQPVDFGLSNGDVCLHGGRYAAQESLTYAKDQWRPGLLILWLITYICICGGLLWVWASDQFKASPSEMLGLVVVVAPLSFWLAAVVLRTVIEVCLDARQSKRSRPRYLRYHESVELHQLYQTTAKAAVHETEQALLRKKRSYWTFLDGYAFERATAEVLRKHQFTAMVTRGSSDGGVDLEVTRNGLRGVVQCKAHINCVGPSVVRDLYGVIHHCGAAFGIVVSRGGFTRGAHDFRHDKQPPVTSFRKSAANLRRNTKGVK
jgi:HJR/Mrr/RecB family endonuclease